MDSITQAALGAAVAGAIAGKRCNGKVLLAGALLGTLPDLDVVISYGDDVSNMIKHRGFSHSLLTLLPFSLLLSWLINKFKPLPGWTFTRLWMLIATVLITHPLLDYFTSYGTQLTWPIPGYYSLSSIFIIDPLYTLPLLIAIGFSLIKHRQAARLCSIALIVSTAYLGWSLIAKQIIEQRAIESLTALGIPQDKLFITPAPLNTILWRIVVLDGDTYWEGSASLLDNKREVRFIPQQRGHWPLAEIPERLKDFQAFTHGFLRYRVEDNKLIVSDLRLGMPGNLAFQFQFAERNSDHQWVVHTPERIGGITVQTDLNKMIDRLAGNQNIDPLLGNCRLCTSHSP
ncbi:metal-dependent hydrolase [Endozoicomonas gorgoniicola]|uniref:Metal-dependent hydrolase n=1 Tax=Endozoicomonas gorgoniicola TaxID=1234144 RepID=A0ABT3MSH0_9GAMM|nr:metal-dependent hydrolase [Endozoicomonas gorgoniicola]MCW7552330.1 metal-dependent hydrolase [Endozoicomonas gorgoniicola]